MNASRRGGFVHDYPKGVRLSRKEMLRVEEEVLRLPDLDDWVLDIPGDILPPLG